ncbi:hypothetical protein FisN_5Hu224 [Fistulifera solaris]|uniref:Uncharacterized protein n=1 Tax=Fistulifera solaris TaxID=1519565 RepID=A0A1Z5JSW2_FISSO|nr:hypothetical protein FisN_5Hu224 [Fistulifera solaris]|eukprot:GAX16851.1 hypothetical protein FisN_5Hu224 [Fistulifera solaris]
MTSQAQSLITPNELNACQVGCSPDVKLFHPYPLKLSQVKDMLEETADAKESPVTKMNHPKTHGDIALANFLGLANNTPKLAEFRRRPAKRSHKALDSEDHCASTSLILDEAARFARLLSASSFHKNHDLVQSDLTFPATKRARTVGPLKNDDPCLPPLGVRYQRRNSFVIPKSRSMAFHWYDGRPGSIESLTSDLSLQDSAANFTIPHQFD